MRLFISVDLPATTALRDAQQPFADLPGVRLVDPETVHFTLVFLGDVPDDRVSAVEAALESGVASAAVGPFTLRVRGYGVFPSREYITVIWVGVGDGGEHLQRLYDEIDDALANRGFDTEDRPFTPHATIARMDHGRAKSRVQSLIDDAEPDLGTTRVTAVELTESTLTPDGPQYRTVTAVTL